MDTRQAAQLFAPHADIAQDLLSFALPIGGDGSHDLSHIARVWQNVCVLQDAEGGSLKNLAAATLLHDCVAVEKNSKDRQRASKMAAERAKEILSDRGWSTADISLVTHAIEAHSFSAGIKPQSLEARILQDADRLDAIGWVGVARCFYVAGRMGSDLYNPSDPLAEARDLNDTRFALDHFQTKLLNLSSGFQTTTGKHLAAERHAKLQLFVDGFLSEVRSDITKTTV